MPKDIIGLSVIFKKHYFLILVLIFASIVLSINLNKPFFGHHDWNGAWYSSFARNFINYGFIETKFGSVMNTGITEPKNFKYFTHYPPMLPILIAISFKFFGIHEWSARIVPLIFSLWTITMIYILAHKFFNKKTAILSSAISACLPIVIYFGKMPVQEVLVIAPVLLTVLFYFDFFEKPTSKNLIKLIASLVFSHLINWPGYYVTPLFFSHYLFLSSHKKKLRTALIFPTVSLFMFTLQSIHTAILTGNPLGGGMIDVLLFRLNLSEKPLEYTTLNFLKQQSHLITAYFTKPVITLSTVSVLMMIAKVKEWKKSLQIQLLLILGIFGVTHNLVFKNMAFIHDYMIIYLWPFFAIAASNGFFQIIDKLKIKSLAITSILAVAITITMFLQSHNFISALLRSNGFQEGYDLGVILKERTATNDSVIILSEDFHKYFDVFMNYYSQRNITYQIPQDKKELHDTIEKGVRLVVAIPSRDTPQYLVDVLQSEYKVTTIGKFVIFNLNGLHNNPSL